MASAAARKNFKAEADTERERRERERREFKEAQELEGLRRTFKRIDKKGDGKIDTQELIQELDFLGHKVSEKEAALTIWEVDDDNDGCVDWDEFRTMFYRVRDDTTGCEPRKLFNVVDFLMLDKNHSGAVDMDECVTLLWSRYGREVVEENLKAMKKENTFEARAAPPRPPGSTRGSTPAPALDPAAPTRPKVRLATPRSPLRRWRTRRTRRTSTSHSSPRSSGGARSCAPARGSSRARRRCRR